jgi:hypothetical protein
MGVSFLIDEWPITDVQKLEERRRAYKSYLQSVQNSLPPHVFEFAAAPWHYDHTDHRCPHDGWLESLTVRENAEGDRRQLRCIEIELLLFGASHDGHMRMTYRAVSSYFITLPTCESSFGNRVGHGDWLVDEFRLSTNGLILHKVLFSSGSRFEIECHDFDWEWIPSRQADRVSAT